MYKCNTIIETFLRLSHARYCAYTMPIFCLINSLGISSFVHNPTTQTPLISIEHLLQNNLTLNLGFNLKISFLIKLPLKNFLLCIPLELEKKCSRKKPKKIKNIDNSTNINTMIHLY